MKKTAQTMPNGDVITTNQYLDETIESFEKRGMNDGSNDDLIKELTIQKLEACRRVLYQMYNKADEVKIEIDLKKHIINLGGNPGLKLPEIV